MASATARITGRALPSVLTGLPVRGTSASGGPARLSAATLSNSGEASSHQCNLKTASPIVKSNTSIRGAMRHPHPVVQEMAAR